MGRAKLNMELITKDKSRNVTYKKRKEGLMRKMHEFSTLCDVDACIIIYGPTNDGRIEPEIWPQDLDEIKRIIGVYKSKKKDPGSKSFGLPDFFHDRKKKIEQDLTRLKKKNLESKYPTWPDFLNSKTESELRSLSAALTSKFEHVRSRVDLLKGSSDFRSSRSHGVGPSHYAPLPRAGGGVELDLLYQQALSSMHVRQGLLNSMNSHDSMMLTTTMMNNESDRDVQIEGASTFLNRQTLYEPTSEVLDSLMSLDTRSMARYYATSSVLPPFLQLMPPPPPINYFSNIED